MNCDSLPFQGHRWRWVTRLAVASDVSEDLKRRGAQRQAMHEESLVRSLLRQVESIAVEHHAVQVTRIEVEIGPLSGVEPLLVASAFERVAPSTVCAAAELLISEVALGAVCENCGNEFELAELKFCCPDCQAQNIRIVRGDQFRLMNVILDTGSELH